MYGSQLGGVVPIRYVMEAPAPPAPEEIRWYDLLSDELLTDEQYLMRNAYGIKETEDGVSYGRERESVHIHGDDL